MGIGIVKIVGGVLMFVGCEIGTLFAGKLVKGGAVAVKAAVGAAKGAKVAIETANAAEVTAEAVQTVASIS